MLVPWFLLRTLRLIVLLPKSIGVTLEKLKTKDNLLICLIIRGNQIIVPSGKDKIEIGDTVLVVTTHQGFNTIEDIAK